MINYSIMDYMTPQWIKYPELSEFTMGWRMGYGEEYRYHFWDWYDTLTSKQQQEYQLEND